MGEIHVQLFYPKLITENAVYLREFYSVTLFIAQKLREFWENQNFGNRAIKYKKNWNYLWKKTFFEKKSICVGFILRSKNFFLGLKFLF